MAPITLHPVRPDDPDLKMSKLLDVVYMTMRYASENNGIGLTQTKAFNRKFSHWAAENFNWEDYSAEKLLKVQKVLNEHDVLPVMLLHQLFVDMKFGRHTKGKFQFNKRALALAEDKASFFNYLASFYLFEFEHSLFQRWPFAIPKSWDVFLNVINVEAQGAVSEAHLLEVFFGFSAEDVGKEGYWHHLSFLHWHVLTPLHWIGFLNKISIGEPISGREVIYTKTHLWRKCLRLETDKDLNSISIH